jgi:hypothetical protein
MGEFNNNDSDLRSRRIRELRAAKKAYARNLVQFQSGIVSYLAQQGYVQRIERYIGELGDINQSIAENNAKPFVDERGIVNEGFVDLDSAKVRIVALSKAIEAHFKLLNKILPDARHAPPVQHDDDVESRSTGETFAEALRMAESDAVENRRQKFLN